MNFFVPKIVPKQKVLNFVKKDFGNYLKSHHCSDDLIFE